MKVLVISGFLGAGKTTFIKEMIKKTKREYVIFENEFGDINIDGEILKKTVSSLANNDIKDENEETGKDIQIDIWESTNGCACCSTKADFMSSLLVIDNTLNPDFLLVEPSGIAMLSNILNNIKKVGYERIELLPPITIIDAQTYFKYKRKYEEIFLDQLKTATHIQLSKTKNLSSEELELIISDIKNINSSANVFSENYYNKEIEYWNNFFNGELTKLEDNTIKDVTEKMENLSYKNACVRDIREVLFFLDKILFDYYGDINRGKGVFKAYDYNIHFDLVDKNYEISFSKGEVKNDIVLIAKKIDKELVLRELDDMRKIK